jgi:hypothetical protein
VKPSFRLAIDLIVSRSDRVARARRSRSPWVGTREHGVNPNTVVALERLGLVEVAWEKGGRRMLCKPTAAGREAAGEVKPS